MRNLITGVLLALLVASGASAQGWRGTGRLHGVVVDADGKPVQGAKVILYSIKGGSGPEPILTDKRGRWAAAGLLGGQWNVDVEAEGFLPRRGSAQVSEEQNAPQMKTTLEPAPKPEPQEQQQQTESVSVGGVEIAPEIVAALDAGNNFMKEQKWAEAAVEYEKAVAALPDNTQLKFALSRAYYGSGQLKKAVSTLTEVYDADTGNITAATLLANMLAEDGQLEQARKVLDAMPPGSLTDPTAIINIGILFMNKNEVESAFKYFDDAVKMAPEAPETYYYRALASLQLKKNDAAKKDLLKVVQLAPDSTEAKDAKELLDQLK